VPGVCSSRGTLLVLIGRGRAPNGRDGPVTGWRDAGIAGARGPPARAAYFPLGFTGDNPSAAIFSGATDGHRGQRADRGGLRAFVAGVMMGVSRRAEIVGQLRGRAAW